LDGVCADDNDDDDDDNNNNTGKQFFTWALICVTYVFFHDEFKYIFRVAVPSTLFVGYFF
jgi:hypothetical protein